MDTGIRKAKILLPKTDDMTAWAVIACDQFTSEKKYWEDLAELVDGKKTTLDLVLPEIYLDEKCDERIVKVNANMRKYIEDGVLTNCQKALY